MKVTVINNKGKGIPEIFDFADFKIKAVKDIQTSFKPAEIHIFWFFP